MPRLLAHVLIAYALCASVAACDGVARSIPRWLYPACDGTTFVCLKINREEVR